MDTHDPAAYVHPHPFDDGRWIVAEPLPFGGFCTPLPCGDCIITLRPDPKGYVYSRKSDAMRRAKALYGAEQ